MTDFYVYVHRKATTGEIFYVGKGKGKRAYDLSEYGRAYNPYYWRVAKKYGVSVEIIETGLQEWYALELEIDLIAYYGRCDLGLGPLVNLTDGGDGPDEEISRLGGKASFKKHKENSTGWFSQEAKIKSILTRSAMINEDSDYLKKLQHRGKTQAEINNADPLISAKRSKKASEFMTNLRKDPIKSSEIGRIGGLASTVNSLRVECVECGMVSNPGAIGRHQKYSGHSGVRK